MQKLALVVDDNAPVRAYIRAALQREGFRTLEAEDGELGLELVRGSGPDIDLVISDIQMPELSGLEVLSALQNDNFDFGSMPIIVLTNSSELSDRNTAHSYGAEYLVKAELTPREVLNMINDKLGLKSPDAA